MAGWGRNNGGWSDAARDAAAKSRAEKVASRKAEFAKWEADNKLKNPSQYPPPAKNRKIYQPKSTGEW